jgi:hypothetical protein
LLKTLLLLDYKSCTWYYFGCFNTKCSLNKQLSKTDKSEEPDFKTAGKAYNRAIALLATVLGNQVSTNLFCCHGKDHFLKIPYFSSPPLFSTLFARVRKQENFSVAVINVSLHRRR